MVSQNIHLKKRHILLMVGLLLIILSGSRMLWMNAFQDLSHTQIKKGQLDLRDWYADDGGVLLLDGEWEFYPSQWLVDGEQQSSLDGKMRKFVQVPGRWNENFHDKESTPYGFGSYRLRIYVNPEEKMNYSVYVSSVRSSSEVYVNGRLLARSGRVGESEDGYVAKNLPYSTTFTADENGVIEIVIQAANFKDVRRSGIIRSIKFGSEAAMSKERNLSLSMQVLASVIFLMHSIYALVLFFLGNREKRLLYFSLLILCVTFMNLISNDEKLFHLLFNIGYEWDFRIANAIIPIACYALLQCLDHRNLPYWRRISSVYLIINIIMAAITLFLSPEQIIMLFPVYYLLAGIAIVITMLTIIKKLFCDISGNVLLLFSIIAISHHFIWIIYWREAGISVVHYPFDLIISVGCFASIWFKAYFNMHIETEKLAAKLQKVNEHKDQFLANTSHEFKNPLHGIINMSQSVLAREKHLIQKKSVDELEMVLTVGQRMTLLLNDLLDAASLREGNPRLQKKVIAIQPVVTGVLDMLQFIVEIKPVKIVNQVPDDFPPVIADENRVIQIVYNLLHNAVKYTNEGDIYIQAMVKDERAFITISDTGIGMDEDLLQRLFRPYEQASDVTMIEDGFGLGLSISKQLIELHGGNLEVSSALGKGSKFTFSLMLASEDEYGEIGNAASMKFQHSTFQMMPVNHLIESAIDLEKVEVLTTVDQSILMETDSERLPILIVDDDPVNLQVLQSILPVEQYDITAVSSGKEALDILDEKEWNLVISDIMMPQMSGYELTKLIRNRYTLTELPILLLTARSEPKDIQAGFLAGANDYVTKPVEMLELRSRVRALTIVKKVVREQLQLEAAWLQAQIQPHFLFNTLNSIIALSEIDLDKMSNLLNELSEFLRNKFQFQYINELVPIKDELNIVRSYLNIEQVRFGDRLEVVWETDVYNDVNIPFLTIQPLVENAIRHGIMRRISGGKIVIKVSVQGGYAKISVEDDGVGMDEAQLQSLLERKSGRRMGVGLINTNQRLKRHFGTGLEIKSTPDLGTVVSFIVSI
ncbi:ATP-binding protein [Bacillus sp. FJAT-50079]|uniref:hybrid sensor histidine kinase/response regulator n=1 Tax=Bacillus sp. FJAT-50079 TaxID=2833577 RepID=UPI001BC9590D|nr:ATP-binding protein [Bacillus sp. FJAT-50079]MBS4210576.1 response regulator [Bacillus sp. FJAT-50079]